MSHVMQFKSLYIRSRDIDVEQWATVRAAAIADGVSDKSDAAVVRWLVRRVARGLARANAKPTPLRPRHGGRRKAKA